MSGRGRGQLIQKGPTTWLIRVHVGNRRYVGTTVHGSRKDAEQVLTMKLREQDTSAAILPQRLTVSQFLDRWLASKVPDVTPKTHQSYSDLLRVHVRPAIGSLRLDKVTPMALQDLITRLSRSLSPRMVQYTATVMGQAFKCAVQWRLLSHSPAQYLRLPRQERQERRILTPDEVRRFFAASVGSPWRPLWVVLLTTGLRPHEALALRWEDVDQTGTIRVARGLRQVSPGHYEVGDLKTKGSRRLVAVPQEVLDILSEHRKASTRLSPWIFCNREGNPWDITKVRRAWYGALAAAGLPQVTLYTARHTHLSHLVMATGSLKLAQDRAGHSSIRLTADTYTHLLQDTRRESAEAVRKTLFA